MLQPSDEQDTQVLGQAGRCSDSDQVVNNLGSSIKEQARKRTGSIFYTFQRLRRESQLALKRNETKNMKLVFVRMCCAGERGISQGPRTQSSKPGSAKVQASWGQFWRHGHA